MQAVIDKIRDEMVKNGDKKQVDVVNATGLKKVYVSKFFSNSITPNFGNVFKISKSVSPDNHLDIIDVFALTADRPSLVVCAFEYAHTFGRDDLLNNLIRKHKDGRKEYAEISSVYSISTATTDADEKLEQMRDIYGNLTLSEMKAKVCMMELFLLYEEGDVNGMMRLINRASTKIECLKGGFFKETLLLKLYSKIANGLLYQEGNEEKAREYVTLITKSPFSSPFTFATAKHIEAHSYIFSNLDKSFHSFVTAQRAYRDAGMSDMVDVIETDEIPFLKNVNKVIFDLDGVSLGEAAHQLIIRGEHEPARRLLQKGSIQENDPYLKTYLGIIDKDVSRLFEAYGLFMERGNKFFAKIVEKAIKEI